MKERLRRRDFLRQAMTMSGGVMFAPSLAGLTAWNGAACEDARRGRIVGLGEGGYGPLQPAAECPEFWIPEGFHCKRLSVTGRASSVNPSLQVPIALDGMASFALPNGNIRLIRNHEVADGAAAGQPIGNKPYDTKGGGGTTSLEVAVRRTGSEIEVELVAEFVSLSGTIINCAGGHTPWNSWLTCEEAIFGTTHGYTKPHGYIFEVPMSATEEVDPVPLPAMGRFVHEAVCVDPATGIVYETEDAWWRQRDPVTYPGSGFYRFIPRRQGELREGGRLQILGIDRVPRYDTIRGQQVGKPLPAVWYDIEDPDPAEAETDTVALFRNGLAKGAASFQRLEGCFWADNGAYIVSTNGGNAASGQVWHYRPTSQDRGEVVLIFESPSPEVLDGPDNICASPQGGLVICEDGSAEQYVRGLTRSGEIVNLVLAPAPLGGPSPTEFCGCCFSPDGSVLFFNVQGARTHASRAPGATYALWGPWEQGGI